MSIAARKKAMTKKMNDKAKLIARGKIKGEYELKTAKNYVNSLRYAIKNLGKAKTAKPKAKKAKVSKRAPKAQAFNQAQGFIPTFLSQMNMVRIEELVAEKLFQSILGDTSASVVVDNSVPRFPKKQA